MCLMLCGFPTLLLRKIQPTKELSSHATVALSSTPSSVGFCEGAVLGSRLTLSTLQRAIALVHSSVHILSYKCKSSSLYGMLSSSFYQATRNESGDPPWALITLAKLHKNLIKHILETSGCKKTLNNTHFCLQSWQLLPIYRIDLKDFTIAPNSKA